MGKTIFFECLSGISGDMTIGALLDLGVDYEVFKAELNKLNVDGYHLSLGKKGKQGIYGLKFDVHLEHDHHHHRHNHHGHDHKHEHHDHDYKHHDHDHKHDHHDHNHKHDHDHTHDHHHDHDHRNLTSIKTMIQDSDLSERVKKLSIEIFEQVAIAEAKIHNSTVDQVHFHEVGAVDSIVDIVGTAICIDLLDVDHVIATPLHVGTGFVKCAHGKMPVPAPATLEILKGIPVYSKGIRSELVTPTGAAIIKVLADRFEERPAMIVQEIGYGLGTKELEIANVLRVSVVEKK